MTDPRTALQRMFNQANHHANFGDVLTRIHVQGFRCHSDTVIEVKNPITAFCGLNGTGKSTLLQLAAAAYRNPLPGRKPYYVKDFLVVGTLDPAPFTDDASVEFSYAQADRSVKTVTVSRTPRPSGGEAIRAVLNDAYYLRVLACIYRRSSSVILSSIKQVG